MTPVEQHLSFFKELYPNSTARALPSGAYLVEVPGITLPPGWSRQSVNVLFLIPPGYPAAQPDCFWVDSPLRLADGTSLPQNSNDQNPIPEVGQSGTWFSWHLQTWSPNQDNLYTFMKIIKRRLDTVQ